MNGEPDLLIGGKWRHASDGGTREIVNPADGSVAAVVDEATPEDARDAVAAARKAFDDGRWPTTSVADRAAVLDRIDEIVPPGTNLYKEHGPWTPPALADPSTRRRPPADRAAGG